MKKKVKIIQKGKVVEKEVLHIPLRFVLAIFLIIAETLAVLAITLACGYYIPYFYILMFFTQVFCVLKFLTPKRIQITKYRGCSLF